MVDILPEDAPAPRLCHLIKWPDFDGYGFNLHAERSNPGQFIGKIDDDSPAKLAGLQEGDRIVEVNGVNISNENHRQVVERIKSEPQETRLLVVDPEADLWYREQDLVVKSSQLNVIYIRTPVPRPEISSSSSVKAAEPEASNQAEEEEEERSPNNQSVSPTAMMTMGSNSLETSDFNDDSIEQHQQAQQQQQQQHHSNETTTKMAPVSPPMSPDSGKGDEVEPSGAGNMLTIEAEINRQSKPSQNQNFESADMNNQAADTPQESIIRVAQSNLKQEQEQQQQQQEEDSLHGPLTIEKSNEQAEATSGSIQPDSLNQNQAAEEDEKARELEERSRKVEKNSQSGAGRSLEDDETARNGSADSGQSSSPDASSNDGSIVDSLEAESQPLSKIKSHTAQQRTSEDSNNESYSNSRRDEEDALTIRNYLEAANNKLATNNNNNNNNNEPTKVTTPIGHEGGSENVLGSTIQQHPDIATEHQPLKSAMAHSNLNGDNRLEEATSQQQNNLHNQEQLLKQQQPQKNSNNNITGGLNLNMTASEMRELIARRKKFDPKKAQMNIRQKYEIIQQM